MGAVPKRKISTHRKGKRRKRKNTNLSHLIPCRHCGANKLSHQVCKQCGKK